MEVVQHPGGDGVDVDLVPDPSGFRILGWGFRISGAWNPKHETQNLEPGTFLSRFPAHPPLVQTRDPNPGVRDGGGAAPGRRRRRGRPGTPSHTSVIDSRFAVWSSIPQFGA